MNPSIRLPISFIILFSMLTGLSGCGEKQSAGISPQRMTDSLFAVMAADRAAYSRLVVNRLQDEEKIIKASEHWKDEKALPLPSQMFRYAANLVAEQNTGFTYALLSEWPINAKNHPKTEAEKAGLKYLVENPNKNYYAQEELGGVKYFTAVYPDVAVAKACVTCHNDHKDSPRHNFKMGEVMGGVVIRIPVDG